MNIPIEVLVIIAVVLFLFIWGFFSFLFKYIKLRRYKPENDKGRKAEESRRSELRSSGIAGEYQAIERGDTAVKGLQRPLLPEGRGLLQAAKFDSNGQNSRSPRKATNPFLRRRK